MSGNRWWQWVFALPFLVVFALTRFDYPIHGDEVAFYRLTLEFGAHTFPSMQLLRTYDHTVTPLVFIVLGLLGRAIGFDLWKMRAVIALLSCFTLLLFYRLCHARGAETPPWLPFYATAVLAFSPYYFGASIYYYTDIPCLFAMMVATTCYLADRPLAGAIASGGALLTRQFSLFLPAAYALASLTKARSPRLNLSRGALLLIPFGMVLPLILLWGGFSPQNRFREMVQQVGYFHPAFVNYLVLATGVYCLPLAILRLRTLFQRQRLLRVLLLAPLFWIAIPHPNAAVLNLPVKTLGYLDIALTAALGDHKTLSYFLLWLLGCLILYQVFQAERTDPERFILFAIGGFFLMNLFAYMVWDKYLLMVLPFVLLSLARGHAQAQGSLGDHSGLAPSRIGAAR